MSRNAKDKRRGDLLAPDHLATCPRCGDLSPGKWCIGCGLWLLDRGPLADELRLHAMLDNTAQRFVGDAPPRREDTQTNREKER